MIVNGGVILLGKGGDYLGGDATDNGTQAGYHVDKGRF